MRRIALLVVMVLMLLPVYFMFTGSLQDINGVFAMPPQVIPRGVTGMNYAWILSLPVARWALNTVLLIAFGVALSVSVVTMAAYAFAFYRFPLKRALWLLLLAGIMVPRIALVIPQFVVISKLGISGTLAAVILPAALFPIGIYLARTYFQTVPMSLIESARMDGASEFQILTRVVAPVSRPIITTLVLFTTTFSLGDYLWQMLQLQREGRQTLLVGLMRASMVAGARSDMAVNPIGHSLAVGAVLLIPLLVVFFSASRYFTSALGGAVKG